VLGTGLVLAAKWKLDWSKDPLPHVREGDQFMKDGKYEDAIEAYAKAIRLKDNDPMIWVKLGDAHNYLSGDDINNLHKARGVWENAITQDPKLIEAHRRLLDFWKQWGSAMAGAGRATYLDRAADSARGILRIKPDDKEARFVVQEAVIVSWLSGAAVDPQKVDDAISELRKLQSDDPENPNIPFTLARAQIRQAEDALRRNDRDQATIHLDDAVKTMDDAIAARPEDPALILRKAYILAEIGPRAEQDKDQTGYKAKLQELNKQVAELAEKARQAMKPEDEDYLNTWIFSSIMQQRIGNGEAGEQMLRDLVKNKPEEILPRIQLAELIRSDPERRQEALDLLTTPLPAGKLKPGVPGQVVRDLERRALLGATDIRLDFYSIAKDKGENEKADALLKQVEEDLNKIAAKEPDSPRMLRVRGKKELYTRDMVACVQTLRRALTIATDPNTSTRYEIMYLLAGAFQITQQTGEAEKLYREMVERVDYPPARLELARLLLQKRSYEEARGHLAQLKQQQPKNPEVLKLELALADLEGKKDTEAAAKRFQDLPEATDGERLAKGRLALAAGFYDETIRIMTPLYESARDNVQYLLPIANAHEMKKELDRTTALLEEFAKRHPENLLVKDYLMRLRNASVEERAALTFEAINKIEDPVRRTQFLFEAHRRNGDLAAAEKALNDAPPEVRDNPKILDCRFQLAYAKGDFDTAESLLEPLSKANQDNANGLIYRTRALMGRASMAREPADRQKYWQQATEHAVRLTNERGDFSSAWMLLAQVYHTQRRYEEAINAYTQAKDRQSTNAEAYEAIIRCYYGLGRNDDAKRIIDEARGIFPNNPLFEEQALAWEMQYGDPAKIIPSREQQVKDNPDSPTAWGNLGATYAAAAQSKSDDEQKQLLEKARQTFADAIAKFPNEVNLVATHGDICLLLNRFEDGLKAWQKIIASEQFKDSGATAARLADFYRRGGKVDEGIKYLTEFVARKDDPVVRIQLAELYDIQKKTDEALAQLAAAGSNPRALKRRVEILIMAERLQEAESLINQHLTQQPDNPDLLNRLAFVYLMSKRFDEGRTTLNKVLGRNPRDPEAMFYSALLEVNNRGDVEKAIATLQTVRDMVPDNVDARKLLVDLFLRRNRLVVAVEEMEAILRLEPEDKFTRIKLIETFLASQPPRVVDAERLCREGIQIAALAKDADMLHAYARTLLIKGDLQGSVAKINEARKVDPDNLPLIDTFFRIMMGAKQYQGVVAECNKLIEKMPEHSWLWSTRASAYARLRQTDKALADFEKGYNIAHDKGDEFGANNIIQAMMQEISVEQAMKFLEPRVQGNPAKMYMLAQVYLRNGKTDQAIATAEGALALPGVRTGLKAALLNFIGTLNLQQVPPNIPKARASYEELLKITPNDFNALNNIAYLLQLPGSGASPQEALQYSQRAYDEMMRNNAKNPELMDTHGWILIQAGQVDQGVNILREALTVKQFAEGFIHLGFGYLKLNDKDEADKAAKEAEKLLDGQRKRGEPVDPTIEKKLQELRLELTQ
jgi:tetratricopeptide (TPR) repeat protein